MTQLKINNKLIRDTTKIAVGAAGLVAANVVIGSAFLKYASPKTAAVYGFALPAGDLAIAFFISRKNPMIAAGIGGATLGAIWQGLAAFISKDLTLLAHSPKQESQIRAMMGSQETAGLPENFNYLLTGS